jgi:L-amino acid N-acyltransferase YncA
MQIRSYQESDLDSVCAIFQEVVRAGDVFPFSPDSTAAEARQHWIDVARNIYVAVVDGEVLGSYYLKDVQPGLGDHVCNAGYMVSPRARGKGLGAAMCKHSLEAAQGMGYTAMQFNFVVSTNESAVRLWQRMGFDIVARLPKAFRHSQLGPVDALVMFREL